MNVQSVVVFPNFNYGDMVVDIPIGATVFDAVLERADNGPSFFIHLVFEAEQGRPLRPRVFRFLPNYSEVPLGFKHVRSFDVRYMGNSGTMLYHVYDGGEKI